MASVAGEEKDVAARAVGALVGTECVVSFSSPSCSLATSFAVASLSKLVTATVVLQCCERGELTLDDDVNDALPSECRCPRAGVTPRALLQHLSGLLDDESALEQGSCWRVDGSDCEVSLAQYVAARFAAPEALWIKEGEAPAYHYSNLGFTLLALYVETRTGRSFATLAEERVFTPLGLTETGWRLDKLAAAGAQLVPPHAAGASVGHYGVAEWPAAGLRTSVRDFLRFLVTFSTEESLILSTASRALMLPPSFRRGLAWLGDDATYREKGSQQGAVWTHGGFMQGVRSHVYLWPHRSVALLILQAGEASYEDLYQSATQALLKEGHLICRRPSPHAARCAHLRRAAALPASPGRDDAERALAPADASEALELCGSSSALVRLRACKAAMALLHADDDAAVRLFERCSGEARLRRAMLPLLPPGAAQRLVQAAVQRGAPSEALQLLPFASAAVVGDAMTGEVPLMAGAALLPSLTASTFWARMARRHPAVVLQCVEAHLPIGTVTRLPLPTLTSAASAAERLPAAALALLTAPLSEAEKPSRALECCAAFIPVLLRLLSVPLLEALIEGKGSMRHLKVVEHPPWSVRGAARAASHPTLGPTLVKLGWLRLSAATLRRVPPGEPRAALWQAHLLYTERSGNTANRSIPALISLLPEPLRTSALAPCLKWTDAQGRAFLAAICADAASRDAAAAEELSSSDGTARCAAAVAKAVGAMRLGSAEEAAAALAALAKHSREAEPARRALADALMRHFSPKAGPRLRRLSAGHAAALCALLMQLQASADTSRTLRTHCFSVLVWVLATQEAPAAEADAVADAARALREWRDAPGRVPSAPSFFSVQWDELPQQALPRLAAAVLSVFGGEAEPSLDAILAAVPSASAVRRACEALSEAQRATAAAALGRLAELCGELMHPAPALARACPRVFSILFAAAACGTLLVENADPRDGWNAAYAAFQHLMMLDAAAACRPQTGLLELLCGPGDASALLSEQSIWRDVVSRAPGLITPQIVTQKLQKEQGIHQSPALSWTALARCSAATQAAAGDAFAAEAAAAAAAADAAGTALALKRAVALPLCGAAAQAAILSLAQQSVVNVGQALEDVATKDILAATLSAVARLDGGGGTAVVLDALPRAGCSAAAAAQLGACVRRGLPAAEAVSAFAALLMAGTGVSAAKTAMRVLSALPGSSAVLLQLAASQPSHGDARLALLPLLWDIACSGHDEAFDHLSRAATDAATPPATPASSDGAAATAAATFRLRTASALLALPRRPLPDAMRAYARLVLLPLLSSPEQRMCAAALARARNSDLYSPQDERPERAVTAAIVAAAASGDVALKSAAAIALASCAGSACSDNANVQAMSELVERLCAGSDWPSRCALKDLFSVLCERTTRCAAATAAASSAAASCTWATSLRVKAMIRTAPDAAHAAASLASLRSDCWHAGSLQAALDALHSIEHACGAEAVRKAFAAAAAGSVAAPFFLRIALHSLREEKCYGQGWTAERRAALRAIEAAGREACAAGDAAGLMEALVWAMEEEDEEDLLAE